MGKRKCVSALSENKGIDEVKRNENSRKNTKRKGKGKRSLTLGDFGATERLFDDNVPT